MGDGVIRRSLPRGPVGIDLNYSKFSEAR